ncbi:MAG: hypothetical protein K0S25_2251 [Bacillus sp. (in: firmicutes)]|nr:hypothetical protein [Paenibacillus sp.]MDF2904613.1 hypothetical protein [Bacillus sp. (in: firmicutes)]
MPNILIFLIIFKNAVLDAQFLSRVKPAVYCEDISFNCLKINTE